MNEEYEVSEDPVGLFCLPNTTTDTILSAIKDTLTRYNLSLTLCGQAYDGAANMQGCRKGVATRISYMYVHVDRIKQKFSDICTAARKSSNLLAIISN